MEPEEYPRDKEHGDSGFLKSFTIYLVIFVFGFVAASFGGGVKDSVKGTANLAVNTAKETFSISSGGVGEFVPLKSGNTKSVVAKTPTINKVKPSLPVVAEAPTVTVSSSSIIALPSVLIAETTATTTVSSTVVVSQPNIPVQPISGVVQNNSNEAQLNPLIYEIRITGGPGKSAEDYIKIFNPNPNMMDLSGWRLKKSTKTGSESSIRVFPDGTTVGAGKVLTWANNGYASVVGAELMSSQTLAANNGAGLSNKDGVLIDAVGWGEIGSVGFVEGTAYPVSPEENQVLLRKQSGGFLVDTQNNSQDFEIY